MCVDTGSMCVLTELGSMCVLTELGSICVLTELGSVYTEKHLWEEGVNGELCLFSPVDVDCGWEADFLFQPPIDRIEVRGWQTV